MRTRSWKSRIVSGHRLLARRGEDHRCAACRTGPASPPPIFGALAEHNVNVDMIVQNISADGTTDMTFTVGKADLPRAQATLAERAGADRLRRGAGRPGRRQDQRRRRRHAQPRRRRQHDVPRAGRQGDQHPGDLHQRDQGQRADRRANTPNWRCARCTPPMASMPPDIATPDRRTPPRGPRSTGCGRAAPPSSAAAIAIMGGAMSWVSERHLVSAISNAGGFGVIACGSMDAGPAGGRDRRHPGADRPAVRREPDHHAPAAGRPDPGLPGGQGRPHRAGRRHPAGRRGARGQGRRREADRLRPGAGAGEAAGPLGRRCAGDRGLRGRRPYRPGVADRAGAGDPAAYPRGAGVRRRRPGRGEAILAYLEMGASGAQLGTRFAAATEVDRASRTSSRPSSAPTRATRCRRCSSTSASR